MAVDLRTLFNPGNAYALTPEQLDTMTAAGMNPVAKGYQSGRLSNEANYQLSQQMALREANNEAAAAALQPKINALRQRASIYAPSVQKVEDINGVGSGLTWLGGQVGQGAASMQDPMLASAALTGVGTGLSFMPNPVAKGAGFLLRNVAAPGVAYGINREQLKGEQYGNLSEDPTVMANHTPQEIASQVGDYANVAGLLDTAVPGLIGRKLGGGALRGAVSKFSPLTHTVSELGMEGLTELAQGEMARQQHTGLNPLRDTSGDWSDRLNDFAGGAAGAAGPAMAGGAADAGFRGIRRGAEGVGQVGKVVTDAAGKTVDMLAPKAEPYISKAAEGLRQAKKMATGKVVDLKGQFQQMSQNRAEAHAEDELIAGEPPKGMDLQSEDFRKWVTESHPQRVEAIINRLGRLQDAGDQTAGQLLERIGQGDQAAVEDGAAHALKQGRIEEVLADYGGKAGSLAASTGRFLKGAATRVAAAAKAGFQKGRKQNAQTPEYAPWTGDEYERRKGEAMASLGDLMATHMSQEAQAAPAVQGLPEAKRQNLSRAAAEMARQLADIAHNWTPPGTKKPSVQQFDRMQNDLSRIARHMVSIYGERAPDVAERLQSFADPKTKAVFGHLQDAISKDSVSRGSVTETKAWQVLKSSIPTEKQAELARDGIDLTAPDVRRGMMAMIEAAANGQLTPQARRQLSGLLGADGLQKVVEAYHPVPDAAKRLDEAWSTAEEGPEDKTPTTSDEDTTSNEGSDFEKRQGEKALAKRGNERVYKFRTIPTPVSDTSLGGIQHDPMTFKGSHRPTLYDLRTTAQQDPDASKDALQARADVLKEETSKLHKHLGVSEDPNEASTGDSGWSIGPRSALDELAGRMGMDASKALSGLHSAGGKIDARFSEAVLRQYRAHMLDLAKRFDNPADGVTEETKAQAERHRAQADLVSRVLSDRKAMKQWAASDAELMERAAKSARARVEAGLEVEPLEKVLEDQKKDRTLGTRAGERLSALMMATDFLASHGVIVAERTTQRDIERITPAQVTELVNSGRALLKAHPDTLAADKEWDHERMGSQKNDVLRFRSATRVDSNGDPVLMPVRGRDLAALGRRARLQQGDERDGGNANARYLEDLASGIAALIDTGLVKGLPEGFEGGQIPKALPLDNTSFENFKFGRKTAAENAAARLAEYGDPYLGEGEDFRANDEYRAKVAGEQSKDYFSPGDNDEADTHVDASGEDRADEDRLSHAERRESYMLDKETGKPRRREFGDRKISNTVNSLDEPVGKGIYDRQDRYGKAASLAERQADENPRSAPLTAESDKDEQTAHGIGTRATGSTAYGKGELRGDKAVLDAESTDAVRRHNAKQQELYEKKIEAIKASKASPSEKATARRAAREQLARSLASSDENERAAGTEGTGFDEAAKTFSDKQKLDAMLASGDWKKLLGAKPELKDRFEAAALKRRDELSTPKLQLNFQQRRALKVLSEMQGLDKAAAERRKTEATKPAAAKEDAAPLGKSQDRRSGAGKVDLGATGTYAAKDQAKSDKANKFIGRGSERSSTARYAYAWGDRANTGEYKASDRVFVSAEGNRTGRVAPDFEELSKAIAARATIITDSVADRARPYNVGEREVAAFLAKQGYVESKPGEWTPQNSGKEQARDEKRAAAASEEISRRITQAAQEGTISGGFLNAQADELVRAGAYEAEVASLRQLAGELSALVAGKHNLGGTAQTTVDGWAARFAGGEKVTVARLPADSAYMKAVGAQHGEFGGAYTKIAGQHFILTGSYRDKVSSLNRLAHEFGHALQRIKFDNAPEKVQEQIRAAWERDIASDDVMRLMSPARYSTDETAQLLNETPLETDKDARRVVEKGAVANAEERAENDPAFAEYLASFHEWFAEQFSKYVTHDFERNVPPAVRSFWRNLIDAFKRYFNAVIAPAEPNKDFAAWVDSLAGPQRKLNAQALQHHAESGNLGFGAAHNSPHEFDGFNWREHLGKGEGEWVYGAGTYMSTAENVHRYYKAFFTEMPALSDTLLDALEITREDLGKDATAGDIKESAKEYLKDGLTGLDDHDDQEIRKALREVEKLSDRQLLGLPTPTYHVSVDIPHERMLDWNVPFSEQSNTVKLRLMQAFKERLQGKDLLPAMRWRQEDEGIWFGYVGGAHSADGVVRQLSPTKFETSRRGEVKGVFPSLEEAQAVLRNTETLDKGLTGGELYKAIAKSFGKGTRANHEGNYVGASNYLQKLGILGTVYNSERGRNSERPNYVIYDDSKVKINYVAFNGQNPSSNASTQAQMEEAKAYLNKILPDVHVAFKEIFGDDGTPVSGEWVKSQNTVFVSTMAGANTLSVAYHEGLHAFFSKFVENDERTKQILMSLADDKKVLARLEALLAQHPAALDQLVDGEERLAYIYQFWASGMLELPRQPRTVFEKIKRFFARVFAQITDQDRAVAILDALHTGKLGDPSVAGQVIAKAKMEGMLTTQLARKVDALVAKVQSLTVAANSMLEMSDSETARKLAMMMWTNPGNEEHGKAEQEGYLNARSAVATQYTNEFKSYLKGLNDTDLKQINEYLQQGTDASTIPFAPHQEAVNKIRALNKRFYRYMTDERGMQLGKFDPDRYFPRVWDASKLVGDGEAFVKMLMTHYKARIGSEENARALLDLLIRNSLGERVLPERMDGVLAPFFASEENRKLAWIEPHHSAEFQTKNLIHTLSTYYHNGARAAEYTHRFGQRGEKLEGMLEDVHKELVEASKKLVARQEFKTQAEADKWRQRRYEQVVKAVGAMEGTLGSDVNSTWRNASVWTTVYQNVRLLPLALFSNMVDPLALVARGGTMSDAYDTFLRGMTQVINNWKDMLSREPKERQADAWERMAEAMGTVDAAMFSHHVADEYSSMYMSTKAKAVNETFFKANGMEAWNRGVRVGATRAAVNFLTRHAKLPDVHSARWLTELGLAPSDLTFDAGGQLILDKNVLAKQKGIPIAQAEVEMEKVHAAVRRWVQGAVITPNAAQRPSWSSDPHYSMFFHLKQFSYSFHQTILKRAVKELEYGNLAPLGSFIWYVPVMMAADITRGLIQGGGQLPAYMKGMTASDWVLRSASRSGLLSVGEIGINAASDLASLGGPAVEQMIDGFSQPIGRTVVDALPASPLVKHLGGR